MYEAIEGVVALGQGAKEFGNDVPAREATEIFIGQSRRYVSAMAPAYQEAQWAKAGPCASQKGPGRCRGLKIPMP